MELVKAKDVDLNTVLYLVRETILRVYPNYYPMEVVDFFINHHSESSIKNDIESGNVWLLWSENQLVGTGTFLAEHIYRVFVLPEFQNRGYGSFIMDTLEEKISQKFYRAVVDASLVASILYEKRGYVTKKHGKYEVENGKILIYEVMEKELYSHEKNKINKNQIVSMNAATEKRREGIVFAEAINGIDGVTVSEETKSLYQKYADTMIDEDTVLQSLINKHSNRKE